MTISLRETIENFQAYILEGGTKIQQEIVGDQDVKDTRLDVYQEGYFLRLLETLSRDFPVVAKLAGEDVFEQLGRDYIRSFPSTHFSIRYAGQHFSRFLSSIDVDPLWSEMAAFEWSLGNTTDAKDAPQLTFEEMAAISPESWGELKLTTHPSLEILSFSYRIPPLWQHLLLDSEKPKTDREQKPFHWLVWRFNRQSYFRPADENQFRMIHAIQAGDTFSEVCAGLCEHLEEDKVISFAAETLRAWITEGIFSTFSSTN